MSNLSRGSRWNQALPAGYIGTLAGCAAFGVAVILDEYYQVAFGSGGGLEVLLRPTHLAEIGAGALIVATVLAGASAAIANTAKSTNWAGYAVHRAGITFRHISGT